MEEKIHIYISYVEEDEAYLNKLKTHLATLRKYQNIEILDDSLIVAGDNKLVESEALLLQADVVLLLASSDYFGDNGYGYKLVESKRFYDTKEKLGKTRVIPVIVRECTWKEVPEISGLSALPKDYPCVGDIKNDAAYVDIANGIKAVIESIRKNKNFKSNATLSAANLADSSQPIAGYPESPDPNALCICIFQNKSEPVSDLFSGIIYPPQNLAKKEALKIPKIEKGFPAKVVETMQRIMLKRDGMETSVGDDDFKVLGEAMFHHLLPTEESRNFFLDRYQAFKSTDLKIILQFDENTKKIATMPWEYLYVPGHRGDNGFFIGENDSLTLTRRLKRDPNLKIDSITLSKIGIIKLFSAIDSETEVKAIEDEINKWNPRFMPETQQAESYEDFKEKVKNTQFGIIHFFGEFVMDEKQACILFKKENGETEKISLKKVLEAFQNKPKVVFLHSTSGTQSNALRNAAFELVDVVDGAIAIQFQSTENQSGAALTSSFYTHLSPESDFESAAAAIARKLVKNHPRLGTSTSFAKDSFKVLMPKDDVSDKRKSYKCYYSYIIKKGKSFADCNGQIRWDFESETNQRENRICQCTDQNCKARPLYPCPLCGESENSTLTLLSDGVDSCVNGHMILDWPTAKEKTKFFPPHVTQYINILKAQENTSRSFVVHKPKNKMASSVSTRDLGKTDLPSENKGNFSNSEVSEKLNSRTSPNTNMNNAQKGIISP